MKTYTEEQLKTEILKIKSSTNATSAAGSLAAVVKQHCEVELQAIGGGAINQAVKAIAIARGFLSPIGIDIVCIPAFMNAIVDGKERTAIRLIILRR